MTFKFSIGAAIFILIAGVYWLLENREMVTSQPVNTPNAEETHTLKDGDSVAWLGVFHDSVTQNGLKSFTSNELGISFVYPDSYLLFTSDSGITVGSEAALLEAVTQPVPGEAPPAIQFAFYHEPTLAVSNIDHTDYLMRWMLEHPELSNFHPDDSTNAVERTTIAGTPAFRYRSSIGLYDNNEYVIFTREEWVVVVSVPDSKNENRAEIFDALTASIVLK